MTDWEALETPGIIWAIVMAVLFAIAILFESFRTTTRWLFGRAGVPIIWTWGCLVALSGMFFGRRVVRSGDGGHVRREEDGNGVELEDLERGEVGVVIVVTESTTEAGPATTSDGGDIRNGDITAPEEVHVETRVAFVNTA